jgi:hypothetical protein
MHESDPALTSKLPIHARMDDPILSLSFSDRAVPSSMINHEQSSTLNSSESVSYRCTFCGHYHLPLLRIDSGLTTSILQLHALYYQEF